MAFFAGFWPGGIFIAKPGRIMSPRTKEWLKNLALAVFVGYVFVVACRFLGLW